MTTTQRLSKNIQELLDDLDCIDRNMKQFAAVERSAAAQYSIRSLFQKLGYPEVVRAWDKIVGTPEFKVGQTWLTRDGKTLLNIVAITDHDGTPVIAQDSDTGETFSYRHSGLLYPENEEDEMDLVTLVEDSDNE